MISDKGGHIGPGDPPHEAPALSAEEIRREMRRGWGELRPQHWNDAATNAHILADLARTFRNAVDHGYTHREIGITLSRIEALEAGAAVLLQRAGTP